MNAIYPKSITWRAPQMKIKRERKRKKSLVGWTLPAWKRNFKFDLNKELLGGGYLKTAGVSKEKFFDDEVKVRITIEELPQGGAK